MTTSSRLEPCPDKPNCVSSLEQNGDRHIEPIAFTGSAESAMNRLQMVIANTPRTTVRQAEPDYLHVEYKSRLMGYIDDLELLLNRAESRFEVRSASRKGYYDFNANRARVEALRTAFNQAGNTTN